MSGEKKKKKKITTTESSSLSEKSLDNRKGRVGDQTEARLQSHQKGKLPTCFHTDIENGMESIFRFAPLLNLRYPVPVGLFIYLFFFSDPSIHPVRFSCGLFRRGIPRTFSFS